MNNINLGGSGLLSITENAICKYMWYINDGCKSTLRFAGTITYARASGILIPISD